jgi:RNA polymerase sigma factor (sigma-70 family)
MPEQDSENILVAFRPLVEATARRFCGKGASSEDLVQEGYLAMMDLLPKCRNRKFLAKFLKDRLPARVRTAARREWRLSDREKEFDPEDFPDLSANDEIPWTQWAAEVLLDERDREIIRRLAEGSTQKEIAGDIGLTQQAVSFRVGQIRSVIRKTIQ